MDQLNSALPDALRQVLAKVRRHLQAALDARQLDLSLPEVHIFQVVQSQPAITPAEIALHSGYDKAVVARKVKRMESAGWLSREQDSADNRRCFLHLTASGKSCCKSLEAARRQAHSEVFHPLNSEEQALLTELLHKCL